MRLMFCAVLANAYYDWIEPSKCHPNYKRLVSAKSFRDMATTVFNFPSSYYNEPPVVRIHQSQLPTIVYSQPTHKTHHYLRHVHGPFVLVTGSSDHPSSYLARHVLRHPRLLHWFSENVNIDHPKITAIPIGVNGFTHERALSRFNQSVHGRRINKLLINFSIHTNGIRKRVWAHFCNPPLPWVHCTHDKHHLVPNGLDGQNDDTLTRHYTLVQHYTHILCPVGNGIDTMRIYESIHLGVVPVVAVTHLPKMDAMYRTMPLLLVDSIFVNASILSQYPNTSEDLYAMDRRYKALIMSRLRQ